MGMDDYLAGLSAEAREVVEHLRDTIRAAAPDAEPGMSYGVPAFMLRRRPLVCFAAFKNHYGFYPMSPEVLSRFADELTGFSTAKGTIRFSADNPLPDELIEKIVKARLEELQDL